MDLSLIIPSYNSSDFILSSINLLDSYLTSLNYTYEIIIVDDGSNDDNTKKIKELKKDYIKLVELKINQGKFKALKEGFRIATGNVQIFTDSDIPFDLEAINYIYKLISERKFHIVIGDRSIKDSSYLELPLVRRLGTFVFSGLVRMLVTGGLFDTQCGLKGFRKDIAKELFPLIRANGFSGDVELLYISLKYNLEIKRIPVRLRNSSPSTVNIVKHGFSMSRKIMGLKKNWSLGYYNSKELTNIASQRYWIEEKQIEEKQGT